MTSKTNTAANNEADRVKDMEPQIFEDENPEKPIPRNTGKIDYSGAQEKTDPKEIALVRKLDRWIMVPETPDTSSD